MTTEINYHALLERARNKVQSIEFALTQSAFAEIRAELENDLELARIALASLEVEPDERVAYELFMEKRFGKTVDRRRAKNGDNEYMAWDMALGWIIWCHRAAMLQGGQPVNQTYNLPELIEGMEVSIDVSTCDADLGNRYFGTVTEALELDTAKNGYILLVQDAEPNFDVNGNSPVTPDSWISCSERMPDDGQWCVVNTEYGYYVQCWSEGQGWLGDDISIPECDVINWMPLPEPPQEVK